MDWGVLASWIGAVGTVFLAAVALYELQRLRRENRVGRTMDALQQFQTSEVLHASSREIFKRRLPDGTYRDIAEARRDIMVYLNYLDGLAIGARQNVYDINIIKDHMKFVIEHAVEKLLENPNLSELRGYFPILKGLYDEIQQDKRQTSRL